MTPNPLLPQFRALLDQWKTLRDKLEAEARQDEMDGLIRSAEAGRVGAAAMKGCINSLEAILPPVDA